MGVGEDSQERVQPKSDARCVLAVSKSYKRLTKPTEQQLPNPWKAAQADNRWRQYHAAAPPPALMPFYDTSSVVRSGLTPDMLKGIKEVGTLLPPPSIIWGAGEDRKEKMLETLVLMRNLLVVRSAMVEKKHISPNDAFLKTQQWRDLLTRKNNRTRIPAPWDVARQDVWSIHDRDEVNRRIRAILPVHSLQKMECAQHCYPYRKFKAEEDPGQKLAHYVLFQLAELHTLHDFASYHPDLRSTRTADGRWCPPPFGVKELVDSCEPGAFDPVLADTTAEKQQAMTDILAVVQFNGPHGKRGWELSEEEGRNEWLNQLRIFLNRIPDAWTNNIWYNDLCERYPNVDLQSYDFTVEHQGSAEMRRRAEVVLVKTHMLLCMQNGRMPGQWYNAPELNRLRCIPCDDAFGQS